MLEDVCRQLCRYQSAAQIRAPGANASIREISWNRRCDGQVQSEPAPAQDQADTVAADDKALTDTGFANRVDGRGVAPLGGTG